MRLQFFQIDAFSSEVFGGNPAGVCPLDTWLPDETLQKIAAENFLPETAFFTPTSDTDTFHIRWFTPEIEMDLCGHATLATAHVIFSHFGYDGESILFHSPSGDLRVKQKENLYIMDFPSRMPEPTELPVIIREAIGFEPSQTLKERDYLLVFDDEETIRNIQPDKSLLDKINLDPGGIIVTAKGNHVDFVSRFFTPQSSILEDPVTGSAHCSLIPFWSKILGKREMTALQLSERGGKLFCHNNGDRVLIGGLAKTYLKGQVFI